MTDAEEMVRVVSYAGDGLSRIADALLEMSSEITRAIENLAAAVEKLED